jgi:hypothetical protein
MQITGAVNNVRTCDTTSPFWNDTNHAGGTGIGSQV